MRDKSSTFLLCCPGYIALRTPLGTPSPDKDTWDAMADEVPCELWQPLSIALTGGHMGIWNNKALWSTFSQVGCNNLKKWETDGGNGRSWEKITSPQTSPREAKHKGSTGDEKGRLMWKENQNHKIWKGEWNQYSRYLSWLQVTVVVKEEWHHPLVGGN